MRLPENQSIYSAADIAHLFRVSRATSYRMLSRLGALRLGHGKYIVSIPAAALAHIAAQHPRRGVTSQQPRGVSRKSVPTHAALPRRGVSAHSPSPEPTTSPYKKENGKGLNTEQNQGLSDGAISQPVDNKNE